MHILSGIQPSGRPHLGNYFSMMKRMVEYQKQGSLYAFIASYHAMTTVYEKEVLEQNILDTAIDFLALGIDHEKSTFWVQSDVPEVTELTWLLSMSLNVSQLELAHSYKDKIANGITPTCGLFYYPVLMAADILLFGSNRVPVGKDQKQHIEITRDIAQRFNNTYGETFILPEGDILDNVALVPGIDGRKMSKSYNNAIYFFDSEKALKKKIMSIVTDSKGVDEPKDPENSTLYDIFCLFLETEEQKKELADRFRTPGLGYGHIKKELFETVMQHFKPLRDKRDELASKPDDVRDILKIGAQKARETAAKYLSLARKNTGITY